MQDPGTLYEFDQSAADLLVGHTPVLVATVRGFVDAGSVTELVEERLRSHGDPVRVATFDVDQLVDYRARRPTMVFESSAWASYDEPELAVDILTDDGGLPYLLLHGPEPDVQWERFVAAVRQVVGRLDVRLTVSTHGVPMAVPHTRPLTTTVHATRPELVGDRPQWFGTVQVPASVAALLELRLGGSGHDAAGVAVHVPHYLAGSAYPQAAIAALDEIERFTGHAFDPGPLVGAAENAAQEVDRQLAEADDVAAVVRALEEQYDSVTGRPGGSGVTDDLGPLPTADELGAQFEQFLSDQRKKPPSSS